MDHQNNHEETTPPPAPAEAKEAWECPVCYSDGGITGQVRLGCGHPVCLECVTRLLGAERTEYGRADPRCPLCRTAIRTTTTLSDAERSELSRKANHIRTRRVEANRYLTMATEMDARSRAEEASLLREAERWGLRDDLLAECQPGWQRPAQPHGGIVGAEVVAQPRPAPVPPPIRPLPRPAPAPQATENTRRCPGCRNQREGVYYRRINKRDGTQTRLLRCEACADAIARE